MRIAVFSTKPYDREFLTAANQSYAQDLEFYEARLSLQTCRLAHEADGVCAFVNDQLGADVVANLAEQGIRLIAMRCAGFNNVDLRATADAGITVARVPAYSPHAVAEHTVGLMLALSRKLYRSYNRVREGNFALEGLLGFNFHGRTVGVVGTGRIGVIVAQILVGFGCRVLAYDLIPNDTLTSLDVRYVKLDELLAESDVISLHCPLMPSTYHMIDEKSLGKMKPGVMLVNTSRGALVDTRAVIDALKSGHVGSLALDVYEEEADLFFEDLSNRVIQDDVFSRILTFPNVLVTGHQAFFTREALDAIAHYTLNNIRVFSLGQTPPGVITAENAFGA